MSALAPTYARFPVEFASGSGCVLVDADGHEYLDFLSGLSVCNTGHCHPHVVEAVQEQAARLMHVGNLYWNAPMVRLAERLTDALARRRRLLHELRRGGERGRDQARPQGAAARRRRGLPRRVPRPHVRRAFGHAAGVQAGAVRAAGARLPGDRPGGRRRPRGGRRAHRGRADGAGARRVRRAPDVRRAAARGARGLRRGRRRARVRRGPDRHGPDRHAMGVRAVGRDAGRDDAREGPRRRSADRGARDRPAARRRVRARRPRLDVRRWPAGVRRRQRGARHPRRPGAPGAACASSANGSPRACATCRT